MATFTSSLPSHNAYHGASADVSVRAPAKVQKQRQPGFFGRLLARLIEARERQAMLALQRHGWLLPSELEKAGRKLNGRNEDSLPFVR
jgi:hypothetical protein